MESFDFYWNQCIKPLKGQEISTLKENKQNIIINVTDEYLERKSSQGNNSKINNFFFQNVYQDLIENKMITRAYINNKYGKRCSSIVSSVLTKRPNVKAVTSPTIALKIE